MAEALKETLFTREMVDRLASAVAGETDGFDPAVFTAAVFDDAWSGRELKARLRHITVTLHGHVELQYDDAIGVLRRALPGMNNAGFVSMVPSDYVAVYGVDDWQTSIPALEEFTTVISAEFAVRPFLNEYGARMIEQMVKWAEHEESAVRRLASEGSRPRLPWAERVPALIDDPSPIIPILDALVDDEDEVVRRSVANSLNDISKDHPDLAVEVAERWVAAMGDERSRTVRHALRTLVKKGYPAAMAVLGFQSEPAVQVEGIEVEPTAVPIGGSCRFSFVVRSTAETGQPLEIDFVVAYARPTGKTVEKVFKGRTVDLAARDSISIRRKVSFAHMSTRTIHPGIHLVTPQVNGKRFDPVRVSVEEGA